MNRRDLFRNASVGVLGLTGLSTGATAALPMSHHVDRLYELYMDASRVNELYVKNDRRPNGPEVHTSVYLDDMSTKMARFFDYAMDNFDPRDLEDPEVFKATKSCIFKGWQLKPQDMGIREYIHTLPPVAVPLVFATNLLGPEKISFRDSKGWERFADTYKDIILD